MAERVPAVRAAKRRRRALDAVFHLHLALFWRLIADDYEGHGDPGARVGDLEDDRELGLRWQEAGLRVRLLVETGETAPARRRGALDRGAALARQR